MSSITTPTPIPPRRPINRGSIPGSGGGVVVVVVGGGVVVVVVTGGVYMTFPASNDALLSEANRPGQYDDGGAAAAPTPSG